MEERIAVLYCNSTERGKGGKVTQHDKVYILCLHEVKGGWVTDFAYGPRGKSFKAGTKTKAPTTYNTALYWFQDVYGKKTDVGRGANQYTDYSKNPTRFVSDDQIKLAFGIKTPLAVASGAAKEVKAARGPIKTAKPAPQPQVVTRQVEVEVRLTREADDIAALPIELRFVWEERLER